MKVGTLVRWRPDGDLGIVVEVRTFRTSQSKVMWTMGRIQFGENVSWFQLPHFNVEILNESR